MNDPSRTLPGDASVVAFPLGGIGTGNVSVGARGQLLDWEIFNDPGKGNWLPYAFFALRAAPHGGPVVCRVLESRLRAPHGRRPMGYAFSQVAGLPRFDDSRLRGDYPFVWVELLDDDVPVSVTFEAFTPLVPLDAASSGLPAAVLRYRVRNQNEVPVAVTVAGSLTNPAGFDGYAKRFGGLLPTFRGKQRNEFRDDDVLRGLWFTSSIPEEHLRYGTVALVTADAKITAKPEWCRDRLLGLPDLLDFWNELQDNGRLGPADMPDAVGRIPQTEQPHVGSLAIDGALQPGEERVFEFFLAWHFPNRPKGWFGFGGLPIEQAESAEIVRNFYATWLDDAWAVARHLHDRLPELERATRAFHDSLFRSSLPAEVVDAVASNITVARSTTCFRLEDGTFAGWEGVLDHSGSCPGSCTHVWNYAQTVAYLFPELERSMRRVELLLETDADGRMNFRANGMFGGPPLYQVMAQVVPELPLFELAAIDGQLGSIVRLYREWKFSGDDTFLTELWPHAVRALEYAFEHWDTDGDFVLDGQQHNTYDVEFYGPNSFANAMFYAALRAAAEMAEHLGETDRAKRYRYAAEHGAETMDRMLWNGEYYVQQLEDVNAYPHQYGIGCLSDQLLGQLHARAAGLGYVLPADHVKQALASIYLYNFRPQLFGHVHGQRTYALDDEAGLLLCTWPHGGRPRHPVIYCDEVWTGIEYQVAAHLIYEGLVDEGLTLVRATRARHDGHRRNPWNEVEAGHHYARSMSSWALLLACSGYSYDALKSAIGFAPALNPENFRCFFSTGSGWGIFSQDRGGAQLELSYGSLELTRIELVPPSGCQASEATINAEPIASQHEMIDGTTSLTFGPVTLSAGDMLRIGYGTT